MNPVAIASHAVGAALGIFGGFWLMGSISPDLPDPDTDPGVEVAGEAEGADEESLFDPASLNAAIQEVQAQEEAGSRYISLIITPTQIESSTTQERANSFELTDVSVSEPQRLVDLIARKRPGFDADQVRQMDVLAVAGQIVWVVELSPEAGSPLMYFVVAGGDDIRPGLPEGLSAVP